MNCRWPSGAIWLLIIAKGDTGRANMLKNKYGSVCMHPAMACNHEVPAQMPLLSTQGDGVLIMGVHD